MGRRDLDVDDRIPIRCHCCGWWTFFSVDVIDEVADEARWTCAICVSMEWDGFAMELEPPTQR